MQEAKRVEKTEGKESILGIKTDETEDKGKEMQRNLEWHVAVSRGEAESKRRRKAVYMSHGILNRRVEDVY